MGKVQSLSGKTKKLLVLFAATVIALAVIAGVFWPSSDPDPEPITPAASNGGDSETDPETETGSATEENPDSETSQQPSLTENDQLLTETYSLTLPVSVRAREIILETHQLITDFERINEETKEFADATRYSCQQFEAAIDPLGSGPGKAGLDILARILESDIGLEITDTKDDLDDNEFRITGNLGDLQPTEVEAINGMIQKLNDINNDSSASESRQIDCGIGDGSNNTRAADINQIAASVNQYIATHNTLPTTWADIATTTTINNGDVLDHYEASSINPANSWTATTPTTAGDFIDASGFAAAGATPTTTTGALGAAEEAAADKVVIFYKAGCVDTDKVGPGGIREMAIAYRLEGRPSIICLEI